MKTKPKRKKKTPTHLCGICSRDRDDCAHVPGPWRISWICSSCLYDIAILIEYVQNILDHRYSRQ